MKYVKIVYNSFLWALIIALTCFKSEWLQMRVNTGYIFFGAWVILVAIFSLCFLKRRSRMNFIFSVCNLVLCSGYGIILYGVRRLQVVPAAFIREGLHQTSIPFARMNLMLLGIVVVGIASIVIYDIVKKQNK